MKETQIIMGMPVTLDVVDSWVTDKDLNRVFAYFRDIDEQFSPFKETSEVSRINRGEIDEKEYSEAMKEVLTLSEETKRQTDGYFDIHANGKMNPSGLVKGWAIHRAANLLREDGFKNFYVNAGSDIEVEGRNEQGGLWKIGIRNPFDQTQQEIVKVVYLSEGGVATSGTYARGLHIYNPKNNNVAANDIASMTVIGPNIYEADRFATAAFAMGIQGIHFIEGLKDCEGYMIDYNGRATMTSGFEHYSQESPTD